MSKHTKKSEDELMDDNGNEDEIMDDNHDDEDDDGEDVELDESDDDDDDDDEEEEEEEGEEEDNEKNEQEYLEKFNKLKESIEENAYLYQAYVDIIQLTRTFGDLDNLRLYREKMAELFPLTENLWLEWIRDEEKLVTSDDERQRVYDLFEKAVQDYLSINLWVEYIQFSISDLNKENGMEKIRSICERAISIAGYDVRKGYTVWEAYRELECAILAGLKQSLAGKSNTKAIEDELEKQTERIVKLFKSQLKVSLDHMEQTFEEFKQFDESKIDEKCKKSYENALNKHKELEQFEQAIENSATPVDKLANYKKYIEHEVKSDENSRYLERRIQCLFERTIADGTNCLDGSIWVDYGTYMTDKVRNDDDRKDLIKLYRRALRNCPWNAKLWINLALISEQIGTSSDEIKKMYNEGMNSGLQTSVDYLEIWHAYIDFLRRNINWDEKTKEQKNLDDDEQVEALRNAFQRAINQLYEFFKHEGDSTFSLEKYWAYVEAKYIKNTEKARKIWNEMIIQKGMSKYASEWIEFYNFERQFGDEKHQRKVLYRAINDSSDQSDVLCELLLEFEKRNGNADSYVDAKLTIEKAMRKFNEALKLQNEQMNNKYKKNNQQQQPQQKQKQQTKQEKQQPKQQQQQQQKEKKPQENNNKSVNLKRKNSEEDPYGKEAVTPKSEVKKDNEGFVIPSLPVSSALPAAKKAKNDNQSDAPGTKVVVTNANKKGDISNKSVFLSNLSYEVNPVDIENVFKNLPGFKEIRLVGHWNGKTKGYGFADFDTQLHAQEALKLDRTPINGRPMFISKCEDKSEHLGLSSFKYPTNVEKNKLFISNLPKTLDKEKLEEIFKTFGKLKDVRIVTYRNGNSKGIAYVEYEDEASAAKAILQTDNMLIGENQISVAISNPPRRGGEREVATKSSETLTRSLGSGTVKSGLSATSTPGERKGLSINLVPRSVTAKGIVSKPKDDSTMQVETSSSENKPESEKQNKKMSNEDFRSLLLNKK